MPHIIDTQFKVVGQKKAAIHFYLESDGSVDFNNDILFNFNTDWPFPQVVTLDPVTQLPRPPTCAILQTWYASSWFDTTLGWGGAPVRNNLVLVRDGQNTTDYSQVGGIQPPADITDYDGTLRISTKDFQTVGSNGTLILILRKD